MKAVSLSPCVTPETNKIQQDQVPLILRFLRNQVTRCAVAFALGAGAVNTAYQLSMPPVAKWQSEDWQKLDLVDGIDRFDVRRTGDDVVLSFYCEGQNYNVSLSDNDVEIIVGLPWSRMHVRVDENGEILAKTSNYPVTNE